MNLKLFSISDKGDINKERLVLKVFGNTDVGDYLLMRVKFLDGEATTTITNTFWFPFQDVKIGDKVIVYSKRGSQNKKNLSDGATAYFFYWGQDKSLWDDDNFGPVILHAPNWESIPVNSL